MQRQAAAQHEYDLSDPALGAIIEPDLMEQLHEDLELLEVRMRALALLARLVGCIVALNIETTVPLCYAQRWCGMPCGVGSCTGFAHPSIKSCM
jgi:hypothetical protein